MDPITHTFVGQSLARTRWARDVPYAGAALVIGANAPDIDVFSFFGGSDFALGFRRGWTHGPLASFVLPAIVAGLLLAVDRLRRANAKGAGFGALFTLAFVGCASHPALDWLNTYGVRLAMPFSDRWFYGDAVFIVDPWLWLALGGAALLGRSRLAAGFATVFAALATYLIWTQPLVPTFARILWVAGLAAIATLWRRGVGRADASRVAAVGLALAAAYAAAMISTSAIGSSRVTDAAHAQGLAPSRDDVMIAPTPANPARWRFVLRTPDGYRTGSWSVLGPAERVAFDRGTIPFASGTPERIADRAAEAPCVHGALSWMRFPFTETETHADGGVTVHWLDARYTRRRTSGFGSARVDIDPDGATRCPP